MIADKTTLSSKGQVVVPKRIRDLLDLEPGEEFLVTVEEDGSPRIVLRRLTLQDMIQEAERELEEGETTSHEKVFDDLRS